MIEVPIEVPIKVPREAPGASPMKPCCDWHAARSPARCCGSPATWLSADLDDRGADRGADQGAEGGAGRVADEALLRLARGAFTGAVLWVTGNLDLCRSG